jgi:hypothetical protein
MDKIYRKYMKDPKKFVAKYGVEPNANGVATTVNGEAGRGQSGQQSCYNSGSRLSFELDELELTRDEMLYMQAVERGDVPKVGRQVN